MDRKVFEALVEEALEDLPKKFAKALKNIHVTVEDTPTLEDLDSVDLDPGETLFGLYHGIPLPDRGMDYANVLPDRIAIYQRPIEAVCRNRAEIVEEIRITVFHELGHYFGMSDEEMEALEY
ncbi:MAG: metallopeptidase family protein, partial [Nitrospirae bacterium]|nr:metallopeptidase family protein [Nitrospirota bacterium]